MRLTQATAAIEIWKNAYIGEIGKTVWETLINKI